MADTPLLQQERDADDIQSYSHDSMPLASRGAVCRDGKIYALVDVLLSSSAAHSLMKDLDTRDTGGTSDIPLFNDLERIRNSQATFALLSAVRQHSISEERASDAVW